MLLPYDLCLHNNLDLVIMNQYEKNTCNTVYFDKKIKPVIIKYANLYNIEPHYIFGIIAVESKFKLNAKNINDNGTIDKGLMQINSSNYSYLSKKFNIRNINKEIYKPEHNIKFGTYLLAKCKNQFNNIKLAIDCYNKGPNKQKLSKKSFYVKIVKEYAYQYKIYQKYDFSKF